MCAGRGCGVAAATGPDRAERIAQTITSEELKGLALAEVAKARLPPTRTAPPG